MWLLSVEENVAVVPSLLFQGWVDCRDLRLGLREENVRLKTVSDMEGIQFVQSRHFSLRHQCCVGECRKEQYTAQEEKAGHWLDVICALCFRKPEHFRWLQEGEYIQTEK